MHCDERACPYFGVGVRHCYTYVLRNGSTPIPPPRYYIEDCFLIILCFSYLHAWNNHQLYIENNTKSYTIARI